MTKVTGEATTVHGIQQNCCELLENSSNDVYRKEYVSDIFNIYVIQFSSILTLLFLKSTCHDLDHFSNIFLDQRCYIFIN